MKCSECPFLLQNANNCIGRIDFGILVQVCVNIGGCSDGTVTKPRLNFLHGDTLGKQKRCTAMAKIVEANMWHIVFFQKSFEMRCEVIRFNDFSNFIYIDIVEIVCTITGTAEFPVFFLIFSHLKQDCLIRCNKRKGTAAGFCLCSVAGNNLKFTINLCLLNGMLDCNGLLFKINGIPL